MSRTLILCLPLLLVACGTTSRTAIEPPGDLPQLRATERTTTVSLSGANSLAEMDAEMDAELDEGGWGDELWNAAVGFSVFDLYDADFRIAAMREEWDRTERVELTFHSREPVHGHVEALIGGYLFREERDWDQGAQSILVDAWGFGFDIGAMIYPFEGAETRNFSVGIAPYARFGMGFSDGDFKNIDVNFAGAPGTSSGELGELRFDFGLGVEARAVIGRTMYFGIGAGMNWWTTTDGSVGTTRDGGGFVVVQDDEFDFRGSDAFVRATVGFYW